MDRLISTLVFPFAAGVTIFLVQIVEKMRLRAEAKLRRRSIGSGSAATGDLFRLEFDEFDKVVSVLCFSKRPIDVDNLVQLHGKHQSLLRDLFARADEDVVGDLFGFFKSADILPLYHDRSLAFFSCTFVFILIRSFFFFDFHSIYLSIYHSIFLSLFSFYSFFLFS